MYRSQAPCDLHQQAGHAGGRSNAPFSDPDFDEKSPGDVWRMMCRAKRWLESRGYTITLDGEYREVKVRKLKPE